MERDPEQKARGHRRKYNKGQPVAPGERRGFLAVGGSGNRRRVGRSQQQHAAGCDQQDQDIEADGPQPCLLAKPQERLNHHRIGDEREKASDIAGGKKEIRVAR